MLTTDDVVRCRTRAKRWDAGCRCGELGDIFFEFLQNDPFVGHGHHDAKGNKLCTKLKKCDPFLDSFRQWGLHAPEAAAVPCEVSSLGEAAANLMNDARLREIFISRGYCECDDLDSMSSGSMSPDLGDTGDQGTSLSPQWEGELELNSASDFDNDSKEDDRCTAGDSTAWRDNTDSSSDVREHSVWNRIRDSLCPPDVLRLRTVGRWWNVAEQYGDFAALWFFLLTNKDETSLRSDYSDNFGSARRAIESGEWPDLTTFECAGKRT